MILHAAEFQVAASPDLPATRGLACPTLNFSAAIPSFGQMFLIKTDQGRKNSEDVDRNSISAFQRFPCTGGRWRLVDEDEQRSHPSHHLFQDR